MIQHLSSLLWVVNLGCIDLNPWYARCDDVDRPDYLHFDLDPVPGATFDRVLETALLRARRTRIHQHAQAMPRPPARAAFTSMCPSCAVRRKSRFGRSPKRSRRNWQRAIPKLITAEYRVAKRPRGRVLVDYNQNAWNRTLASRLFCAAQASGHGVCASDLAGD